MTQLRITRFFEEGAVEIRNRRVVFCTPGDRRETILMSLADLRRAVDEELHMPRCPIEEAVEELEHLNGAPFFGRDERECLGRRHPEEY